jgi:hypothetical protein
MSKVVTPIRHQAGIRAMLFNVINPCATESRVAITTSKLTSSIKRNLQGLEVNVFGVWDGSGSMQVLNGVDF